jgi:hypothetical protein
MLLFFSVARSPEIGSGERAVEGPTNAGSNSQSGAASATAAAKPAKAPAKPKLGEFNIPGFISSPFQAQQWLDAA